MAVSRKSIQILRVAGIILAASSLAVLFVDLRAVTILNAVIGLLLGAYLVLTGGMLGESAESGGAKDIADRTPGKAGVEPAAQTKTPAPAADARKQPAASQAARTKAPPKEVRQVYRRDARQAEQGEGDVIQLVSLLQERGRFVDFLNEDVTRYSDEQVGAAARVLHEGCRSVIKDFLDIEPVHKAEEGSLVELPADFVASDYKVTGDLSGDPPYRVRLQHKGWRMTKTSIPRLSKRAGDDWPPIAPAQVDVP